MIAILFLVMAVVPLASSKLDGDALLLVLLVSPFVATAKSWDPRNGVFLSQGWHDSDL
jgi:hypothetical protein